MKEKVFITIEGSRVIRFIDTTPKALFQRPAVMGRMRDRGVEFSSVENARIEIERSCSRGVFHIRSKKLGCVVDVVRRVKDGTHARTEVTKCLSQ